MSQIRQMDDDEVLSLLHDLRNLLAVILNYSELIAGETADPPSVQADIVEVRAAATKAIALTERFSLGPARSSPSGPPASAS